MLDKYFKIKIKNYFILFLSSSSFSSFSANKGISKIEFFDSPTLGYTPAPSSSKASKFVSLSAISSSKAVSIGSNSKLKKI